LGFETVCLHFVFSRPDRWVFGWKSTTDGGRRFCCFAGFSEVVRLKMSDQGDIWGDPKGKSISRGEKRRMEAEARGPRFLGASGSNNDGTKPSEECKAALFQALYEWFQKNTFYQFKQELFGLGGERWKRGISGPRAEAI
jgi:hypothetical protein